MTTHCKAQDAGIPCNATPTHTVTGGCQHEHIGTDPVCTWHAQRLQAHADAMACRPCLEGPQPHNCLSSVTIAPMPTAPPTPRSAP